MTLVAVDAGGTRTRAAVIDDTGRLLGLGTSGSGNPTAVGREPANAAVIAAITSALAEAELPARSITGGAICSAGQQDADRIAAVSAGAGINADASVALVGDAVGAFLAVADEPSGIALVVGTGSVAIRVEDTTIAEVFDGAGWLLGDLGSGFWLGQAVAVAVAAELDGRGPSTALTPGVLERVGTGDVAAWGSGRSAQMLELLRHTYTGPPVRLAGLAELAFTHAADDPVAANIVATGAQHVTDTLRAAREAAPGTPIAGSGSVLVRGYLNSTRPANALTEALTGSDFRACDDGLVGAAVLALHRTGVARTRDRRERLAAAIRQRSERRA